MPVAIDYAIFRRYADYRYLLMPPRCLTPAYAAAAVDAMLLTLRRAAACLMPAALPRYCCLIAAAFEMPLMIRQRHATLRCHAAPCYAALLRYSVYLAYVLCAAAA